MEDIYDLRVPANGTSCRRLALGPFELLLYRPILIWARYRGTIGFIRSENGSDSSTGTSAPNRCSGGVMSSKRRAGASHAA